MERKEHFSYLEHLLTFLLFIPLPFLFPAEVLPLRLFLCGGVIIGAITAYISREKFCTFRKFATLTVNLAILSGTLYYVLNSSFLYREVIIICIKSLSLLIVASSFSSFQQSYLNSMQVFCILLFLCICALAKNYSGLFLGLSSGFALTLLAVTRAKFHALFANPQKIKNKYQGINALFVIILILSALLAWTLFFRFPLGKISTLEALKEEDLTATEEWEKEDGESLPEEQLQKELTELTFKLSSTDEMHKLLAGIQDLIAKREQFACEVNAAKKEILDILEKLIIAEDAKKAKELYKAVKLYTDKKTTDNLSGIKNQIKETTEANRASLGQKFAILNAVNRLDYSDSASKLDANDQRSRDAINRSFLNEQAKRQLRQLEKQFKEWKAYQLYSQKLSSLQKKIAAMDQNESYGLSDLINRIDDFKTDSGYGMINDLIKKEAAEIPPERKKALDEMRQLIGLKKILLSSKEMGQLRKKLEESGQQIDRPPELEEALDAIEESRNPGEILEKINKLVERIQKERYFQISGETKEIIKGQLEDLIKESINNLKTEIKQDGLADSGEDLLKEINKMNTARSEEELSSPASEIKKLLKELGAQGRIDEATEKRLTRMAEETGQLIAARIKMENMDNGQEERDNEKTLDYKKETDNLIDKTRLEKAQKEQINKLMEKLRGAQTINQVKNIVEAINKELELSGEKSGEMDKFRDLLNKEAETKKMLIMEQEGRNLREEIEALKELSPQQAAVLEDKLDTLKESKNEKDVLMNADELKNVSESDQLKKDIMSSESADIPKDDKQQGELRIEILPAYAILPIDGSIGLNNVAIYDNFIKEISPELEWSSSRPNVVFVSQSGIAYAKGAGEAEITCRYKDTISTKCKITVVGSIPEEEFSIIRKEAAK